MHEQYNFSWFKSISHRINNQEVQYDNSGEVRTHSVKQV